MDQLFKQLGGAGGNNNPFGNLQGLFNSAGMAGAGDS